MTSFARLVRYCPRDRRCDNNHRHHLDMRRYDHRNMSDTKNSAYAALVSNISEKDRAQDVEHFDEDTHKRENRFWHNQR